MSASTTGAVIEPGFATVGRRVGGYAVDYLLGMLITIGGYAVLIAGLASESGATSVVGLGVLTIGLLAWTVYYVVQLGRKGATPGHRAVGVRVVDKETGDPIGIGRAFLRQLVLGLLGPLNLVQLFTIPAHTRNQGWHDTVVRSVVIDARRTSSGGAGTERSVAGADQSSGVPSSRVAPPPAAPLASLAGPQLGSAPVGPGMVAPPPTGIAPPPAAAPTSVVAPPPTTVPEVAVPSTVTPPPVIAEPPSSAAALRVAATPAGAAPDEASSDETAISMPLVPAPPAETRVVREAAPIWVLSTGTGSSTTIDGLVLVGRAPDTSLITGARGWSVDEATVSKTHALVGVVDGVAFVEDWHSTNGVMLVRANGEEVVRPHIRTPLADGDVLELGELRVMVQVSR